MTELRLDAGYLRHYLRGFFEKHGVDRRVAASVARNMVWSELAGRSAYGLARVPVLVKRLAHGVLNGSERIVSEERSASIVRIDGCGGFGTYVAERAMDEAILRARTTGLGVAAVCNSNSFGAGAYYLAMAADAGMVSLVLGNSFPKVAPHGGLRPVFGTNPMAFGAPRRDGRHLLVDMATSAMAGSAATSAASEGKPLPAGVAIDSAGAPLTDATGLATGALLPFGGAKGFGLQLMVEILAGVLTGAGVTAGVASIFQDFTRNGDNGHFMLALDIGRFLPRALFDERLEALLGEVKAAGSGVRLPGETRWDEFAHNSRAGIVVDPALWRAIGELEPQEALAVSA
jgi:ureidoglycolate dehydrogenase (NAD+)